MSFRWRETYWIGVGRLVVTMAVALVTLSVGEPAGEMQELCTNEIFKATCAADEIVVMMEAKYGRMRQSRCVVKNYGFIGCHGDVLSIADDMCSGRHSCSIRIPNEQLDAVDTKCPEDFKSYFEARHICVKVATAHHGSCRRGSELTLREPEGVIASIVTSEKRCGSAQAPWIIQVRPGQRINITLLDYSYGSENNAADHTQCYAYATIKELTSPERGHPVCGGRMRESHVYTSIGSKLQVVIFAGVSESNTRYFAIKYNAIGCPDPVSLTNGWFRRHGNTIDVGCNDSTETYTAVCAGTHWDKEIKNCSVVAARKANPNTTFLFSMSYEIAIVIILAIALVIASAILCIGVVCMRRFQQERSRQLQHRLYTERAGQLPYMTQHVELGPHKSGPAPCVASYEQYRTGENLYASIQENMLPLCSTDCKLQHSDNVCTCRHEISREPMRDSRGGGGGGTGSGPYSSLDQTCAVGPEPISPTSRSECSSIFPETGRPYYVLDPRDPELE